MWDYCGMARNKEGPREGSRRSRAPRGVLGRTSASPAADDSLNQTLEKAGRVADFFELGELMCRDALDREESCGGHFREEHQTEEGEAKRDDETSPTSRPGSTRADMANPVEHKEPLEFEYVKLPDTELQVTNLTLKIWRQDGPERQGRFETYEIPDISDDMSFLEMLDVLNERSSRRARSHHLRPRLPRGHLRHVRLMINGRPTARRRAPPPASCTCAVQGRRRDHHRAVARHGFPVIKDLMVDRSAFDRIIEAGGYISPNTGARPTPT
jgi:hypothetical protein